MIPNLETMTEKIVSLLGTSITPVLDDFSFEFEDNIIDRLVPSPDKIMAIIKNETFNIFIFIKEGLSSVNT